MKKLKNALYTFLCVASTTLFGAEYRLGQGYRLADTPVYVGGYFSLEASKNTDHKSDAYKIDDLSLLSYGSYKSFSYMAEFEFKDLYESYRDNDRSFNYTHTRLYAERLYVDDTINENMLLRLGKYNSNVGYWNLTPINVLRDTTSSPLTTQIIFPKYTTGLDLSYHIFGDDEIVWNLTLQSNDSLDSNYNNFLINKHLAGGLEYIHDDLSLKLNAGYFHNKTHTKDYVDNHYLYGSFLYDRDTFKLSGAVGSRWDAHFHALVRLSAFVQGVYAYRHKHFPVLRIEYVDTDRLKTGIQKETSVTVGYTYRPLYPVALKIEFQHHTRHQEDKILASFAVMF